MSSVKFEFCSKFCIISFLTLIFIYFIILLSVFSAEIQQFRDFKSLQTKYSSDEMNAYSNSIYDSYEKASLNPINSLYIVTSNFSCSNEDELLNLYFWNTQTICVCPYNSQFTTGACAEYTNKNCYTTDERQLYLYEWKGLQLCASRISNWYKKSSDTQCSSDYIGCARNICAKKNNSSNSTDICPITSVQVVENTSEIDVNGTNSSISYTLISNLSDGSKLYFSRNYDDNFIIDLQVEMNDVPCIFELEAPIRTSEFQLLKAKPNGCSQYGNDKNIFTQVDSQKEWDFYADNQIENMTQDIKNIKSFAQSTAKLFSVTRTETICTSSYNLNLNDPLLSTLANLRNGGDAIGIILVVLGLILFIIHVTGIINKRLNVDSLVLGFLVILIVFIQGIICPISLYYVSTSITDNQYIYDMNSKNCFVNQNYNQMNDDLAKTIIINTSKVYGIIYTILYFSLIMFILIILYLMDKLKFNYFFDEDAQGILEESNFAENCKMNMDDIDCDCLL